MNPVVSHTASCQYCLAHFTEKSKALAEASRNAHEEVCGDNPDNRDSTSRKKGQ